MEADGASLNIGEELLTLNGKPKCRTSIPLEALRRHVCVLGTTGSGKSTFAKILCTELKGFGVPTLVLDRTGEYVAAVGESAGASVFTPGKNLTISMLKRRDGSSDEAPDLGAQVEDWVSLLDHYAHATCGAGLSPLQARVLRDVLSEHYHGTRQTLTVTRLIELLQEYETDVMDVRGWPESIEAVISRLWPLVVGLVGEALDRSYDTFVVADVLKGALNIIDLSVIEDDRAKTLLSQVVLKKVYDAVKRMDITERLRIVVIVDEAQFLAPNERGYTSVPEKCAIELRKYGFSLVMCATRPSLISANVVANSNTLVSFMLNNQDDVETVAGYFVGGLKDGRVQETLRRLPVGEAMVQLNHPQPRDAIRCRIGTEEQRRLVVSSGALAGLDPQQ